MKRCDIMGLIVLPLFAFTIQNASDIIAYLHADGTSSQIDSTAVSAATSAAFHDTIRLQGIVVSANA